MKVELSEPSTPAVSRLGRVLASRTNLLDAFFGPMPMGIAVFDRDLRLRRCNSTWAAFVERHGVLPADQVVPGLTFFDCYPGTEDTVVPVFSHTLDGNAWRYEAAPLVVKGVTTYWDVAFSPLFDGDEVVGLVEVATDVTDRIRAEHEVRRRQAILEAVGFAAERFLQSPAPWPANIPEVMEHLGQATGVSRVYIFENYTDADGTRRASQRYEWVAPGISAEIDNPKLQGMAYEETGFGGIAERQRRGLVVTGQIHELPVDEPARAELVRQGILTLAMVPIFVDNRWWGFIGFDECVQERHWSSVEIEALRAAARILSAAIQRHAAEDRLRAEQAQYRHVFEATVDGLVITDLDAALVEANPAFHRMHGYEPGELTGRHASAWVHPDYLPVRDEYSRAIAEGGRYEVEAVNVRKDGTTVPVHVNGSAFTFRGRPHVLGVVRDDTERVRAFRLLEQRVAALTRIAASLTVTQPLPITLETLASAVVETTPAIAGSVFLDDGADSRFHLVAGPGLPPGYVEAIEQCWAGGATLAANHAARHNELVVERGIVATMLDNPAFAPMHHLLHEVEWDTVVFVPLQWQGRALGSLNAYFRRSEDPTDDEIAFLRAVADQGAVAVENARLLAEAQSKAGLEERQRLARELHDSVSQALYGIALGARTARALADRDPAQLGEPLDYILALADAGMAEMRSLIFELRPEALLNEGLVGALDKQVAALRSRHQIAIDSALGDEPELPLAEKEALYRIAQEAMHNTVKHARASRISLRLGTGRDGVALEVRDDGIGFDPTATPPGHLGLQSMRERLTPHGGTLEIRSELGRGTVVRARVPLPA